MADLKIMERPPDEKKLQNLLATGEEEMILLCQQLIDRHKLPYIIYQGKLRSAYTNGELYLRQFITIDEQTLEMKADADKMAKSQYEVLVQGPTGVGKEIISKSMIGNRAGDIKSVNCAGFPRELIESELFGYVRGAFTGAGADRDGLMVAAESGVMFMDEIGELPLDMQAKLLRAVQDKTVRKVGGKVEEKISCKFVFATNRDLKEMVKRGEFREDLYARISTLELKIKPLKERICDVIPIAESMDGGREFLEKYGDELRDGILDLSLNVRSIQQYIVRYKVLGRIQIERPI